MDYADRIIETYLRYDDNPPSEEWTPVNFGKEVGTEATPDALHEVCSRVLRELAACSASDILEGVFAVKPWAMSVSELYDEIPHGSQIDTAGAIIGVLSTVHEQHPDAIAAELCDRLEEEEDEDAQNRLSFGLWVLFNGETLLVSEDKVVGHLVAPINERLTALLRRKGLSTYCCDTLRSCLK